MIDHDAADARELKKLARYVKTAPTDTDATDAIESTCGAKGIWLWRSTDGTRAKRGNAVDSTLGVKLANTFTQRDPAAAIPWRDVKFELLAGSRVLRSTIIYSGSGPPALGGPYAALLGWPSHRKFLGELGKTGAQLTATITGIRFSVAGTVISSTAPGNWSLDGDPGLVTMPSQKPVGIGWDWIMEFQTRLDGQHSQTLYELLTGKLTKADARHFGLVTGGADLLLWHTGDGAKYVNASKRQAVTAEAVGNDPGSNVVVSEFRLYAPDLPDLKLGGIGETFYLQPRFGVDPNQEVFFNHDRAHTIKLASDTNLTLDLKTTFGGNPLTLNAPADIYLPDGTNIDTANIAASGGKPPYTYHIVDTVSFPGGLEVTVVPSTGVVEADRTDTSLTIPDGVYEVIVGVTDADSNVATDSLDVRVGEEEPA